jgi:SAM-dependent methyltransferase
LSRFEGEVRTLRLRAEPISAGAERSADSAKAQQRIRTLFELLGDLREERCLLLTDTAASAVLHGRLRGAGGSWQWADLNSASAGELSEAVGEPVVAASTNQLPFADSSLERVVLMDVHADAAALIELSMETARILRPHGVAILHAPVAPTPRSVSVLRHLVGRAPVTPNGSSAPLLLPDAAESIFAAAGLRPLVRSEYSGLFTELAQVGFELTASRNTRAERHHEPGPGNARPEGHVSVRTRRFAASVLHGISALDRVSTTGRGYAVAIAAMKIA